MEYWHTDYSFTVRVPLQIGLGYVGKSIIFQQILHKDRFFEA